MTIVLLACAAIGTTGARADLPQPVTTTAPVRANEPVVLTGSLFPDWSAGSELTFRASQVPVDYGVADSQGLQPAYLRSDCYVANPPPDVNGYVDTNHDDHNCYQSNQLPFRTAPGRTGVDPNALLGYRWDGKRNRSCRSPFKSIRSGSTTSPTTRPGSPSTPASTKSSPTRLIARASVSRPTRRSI